MRDGIKICTLITIFMQYDTSLFSMTCAPMYVLTIIREIRATGIYRLTWFLITPSRENSVTVWHTDVVVSTVASQQNRLSFSSWVGRNILCGIGWASTRCSGYSHNQKHTKSASSQWPQKRRGGKQNFITVYILPKKTVCVRPPPYTATANLS